ncbi:hypothetical protein [Pseudomonas syringae]|uniref:hypothetical protein n=1 Tax=Pseudomonas syringae TaxID=317 RepID=UPI000515CAEC|nr:hypothetical protein [Pseudomonas syringae]UZS65581.1 hypothetical protein OQB65_14380 [Pseudomonas syringae]
MQGKTPDTLEERVDRAGAHFLAASVVLSQPSRASSSELESARINQENSAKFLIANHYIPKDSFFKPLPENDIYGFAAIAGQDGCIPHSDGDNAWVVRGPAIQAVLSGLYPTWFHSLKAR